MSSSHATSEGAGVRLHRAVVARAEVVAGKGEKQKLWSMASGSLSSSTCNINLSIVIVVVSL